MKKLTTLVFALAIAFCALASRPRPIGYSGLSVKMKPEAKLLLQQEILNFEKGLPVDESKLLAKKSYVDKDGSIWTASFALVDAVVNLYQLCNCVDHKIPIYNLTYYLVIMLIQKNDVE